MILNQQMDIPKLNTLLMNCRSSNKKLPVRSQVIIGTVC
jgi:hypothetical protein